MLRVFDTAVMPLTASIDQNTFFGYPAAINRTTGVRGPVRDRPELPVRSADAALVPGRADARRDPRRETSLGSNHLDIAVSKTASPPGAWTIYRLPVQDDGTDGTPDHGCPANNAGTGHGPCLGDYPHIGADANGFYITTNEYSFFPATSSWARRSTPSRRRRWRRAHPRSTVTQFDTSAPVSAATPDSRCGRHSRRPACSTPQRRHRVLHELRTRPMRRRRRRRRVGPRRPPAACGP